MDVGYLMMKHKVFIKLGIATEKLEDIRIVNSGDYQKTTQKSIYQALKSYDKSVYTRWTGMKVDNSS